MTELEAAELNAKRLMAQVTMCDDPQIRPLLVQLANHAKAVVQGIDRRPA
jgi:hypothetical protein